MSSHNSIPANMIPQTVTTGGTIPLIGNGGNGLTIPNNGQIIFNGPNSIGGAYPYAQEDKYSSPRRVLAPSVELLEEQIAFYEKHASRLKEAKEVLEKAKYKPKDVVYHKDYGNAIIAERFLEDHGFHSGVELSEQPPSAYKIYYNIIYANGGDYGSLPSAMATCLEEDLVAFNEMTQTLFNK